MSDCDSGEIYEHFPRISNAMNYLPENLAYFVEVLTDRYEDFLENPRSFGRPQWEVNAEFCMVIEREGVMEFHQKYRENNYMCACIEDAFGRDPKMKLSHMVIYPVRNRNVIRYAYELMLTWDLNMKVEPCLLESYEMMPYENQMSQDELYIFLQRILKLGHNIFDRSRGDPLKLRCCPPELNTKNPYETRTLRARR